jgi:hypothetical protein
MILAAAGLVAGRLQHTLVYVFTGPRGFAATGRCDFPRAFCAYRDFPRERDEEPLPVFLWVPPVVFVEGEVRFWFIFLVPCEVVGIHV